MIILGGSVLIGPGDASLIFPQFFRTHGNKHIRSCFKSFYYYGVRKVHLGFYGLVDEHRPGSDSYGRIKKGLGNEAHIAAGVAHDKHPLIPFYLKRILYSDSGSLLQGRLLGDKSIKLVVM